MIQNEDIGYGLHGRMEDDDDDENDDKLDSIDSGRVGTTLNEV